MIRYLYNIIVILLSMILIVACGSDNDNPKREFVDDELGQIIYPQNGLIEFSNIKWRINATKNIADSRSFCLTNENNIYVDEHGRLNLFITQIDGLWYGAEIISDTVFGFGEYYFYTDSFLDSLDINSSLSFIALNVSDGFIEGITQLGTRFSYWGEKNNPNALEYFVYATDNKVAETAMLDNNWIQHDSLSSHLISIRENSFGFATYHTHDIIESNLFGDIFVSREHKSSMSNHFNYSRTSAQNRVLINFCLSEANEPNDAKNLHIVISRFEFTPTFYDGIVRK